ncbi:hypothetical protein MesoLj131a_62040 [Mesorhizobium sp. 131-2-1]|nr:hypothetical protein MesoLj131a_62040 [Mesorhizobium sp. 131-2-1]BCH04411.1 hypothetical protein MesoLj131b_64100 [Mesorhizobium sp. 131-2-5]
MALAERGGASRSRLHRFRQPFRKDPLTALRIGATEPPGVKPDFDYPFLPRQISHPAQVVAVDAAGKGPNHRRRLRFRLYGLIRTARESRHLHQKCEDPNSD